MKNKTIGLICGILVGLMGCGNSNQENTCQVGTGTIWYETCGTQTKNGKQCIKCTVVALDGAIQGEPISVPDGGACSTLIGGPGGNLESCVDSCQECD